MLSTILMMAANKMKYQYSLRLERPLKTAYFLSASTNQLILSSSSCHLLLWDVRWACGRRILAPGICRQFCGECVRELKPLARGGALSGGGGQGARRVGILRRRN